jgi:hypothetical protein
MPEETEEKLDEQEEEISEQPKRTVRRREGTMNKSFKFPPDPTSSGPAPPVPGIPRDLPAAAQQLKTNIKGEGSDEVAMVVPSSVEVPPPPPIEKERTTSTMSDLDDVGETEEISLN